ncbi:hypothetical protein EDB89DRAFT_2077440 [Lactarius sanguifluus]|nr:hypothetical protein EDB89DRAFT_2077440 [Lactarius sanguifluus]
MKKAKSNVKKAQKALAEMMAGNEGADLDQVNGNIALAVNEMGAMMMMGNTMMMACKRDQPGDEVSHVCGREHGSKTADGCEVNEERVF